MIAFPESLVEPTTLCRIPSHLEDTECLGDEIARLAAHLHAATYQLLVLIRAFDEQEGWGGGFLSGSVISLATSGYTQTRMAAMYSEADWTRRSVRCWRRRCSGPLRNCIGRKKESPRAVRYGNRIQGPLRIPMAGTRSPWPSVRPMPSGWWQRGHWWWIPLLKS